MEYKKITKGAFLSRPNRFLACVEMNGRMETVHVKNTGRCRELLTDRAEIFLAESDSPGRKTKYDLVAVRKDGRLINMDAAAPNKAVEEWLKSGALFPDVKSVRPETKYGSSRFDFYVETKNRKIFLEVKGVTLEKEGVAMFPDAPSERAVKHIHELLHARAEGYEAYILFVIQMKEIFYFTPNAETHPAFCRALREAEHGGVHILAYDCDVWENGMSVRRPVEVRLWE